MTEQGAWSFFSQCEIFLDVIEHKGIAAAARARGVDERRIGKKISTLEQRLGVRLIDRSTRYRGLTADGASFLARMAPVRAKFASRFEQIIEQVRDGTLTTMPDGSDPEDSLPHYIYENEEEQRAHEAELAAEKAASAA